MMKPEYVGLDACDWCWKAIKPDGLILRNRKKQRIVVAEQGPRTFCGHECLENYLHAGLMSLYELGRRDGEYWGKRSLVEQDQ